MKLVIVHLGEVKRVVENPNPEHRDVKKFGEYREQGFGVTHVSTHGYTRKEAIPAVNDTVEEVFDLLIGNGWRFITEATHPVTGKQLRLYFEKPQ
jgi:hypothetical protein